MRPAWGRIPCVSGRQVILVIGCLLSLAGCGSSDERQWMKINVPYTTAEFRRDLAECSKGGTLSDDCMRGRGWVALTPKAPKEQTFEEQKARERRGYGY